MRKNLSRLKCDCLDFSTSTAGGAAHQIVAKSAEDSVTGEMGEVAGEILSHLLQSGWLGIGEIRLQESSHSGQAATAEGTHSDRLIVLKKLFSRRTR